MNLGTSAQETPLLAHPDDLSQPPPRIFRDKAFDRLAARVARSLAVDARALFRPRRGSHAVTRARHVVIYLAHVALGLSYGEIAARTARSVSAVGHAVAGIEGAREDAALDALIAAFEREIATAREVAR